MPEAYWLETEERRSLEDLAANSSCGIDARVLAWAKVRSWGQGQEFACCKVRDLNRDRANLTVLRVWREEDIPAILDELVIASQRQCADELQVPLNRVRAAVMRLEKKRLLRAPWVESRSFVTKYKIGKGFQAHLAMKQIRALCPLRREV